MLIDIQKSGKELTNEHKKRFLLLEQYEACIQIWLDSLPEDEAYAVQRHLIDGIDWPRIATEYSIKWGNENARTDRTLMSYQKKAIQRIADSFEHFPLDLTDEA
jgi:hypothetical protein